MYLPFLIKISLYRCQVFYVSQHGFFYKKVTTAVLPQLDYRDRTILFSPHLLLLLSRIPRRYISLFLFYNTASASYRSWFIFLAVVWEQRSTAKDWGIFFWWEGEGWGGLRCIGERFPCSPFLLLCDLLLWGGKWGQETFFLLRLQFKFLPSPGGAWGGGDDTKGLFNFER